MTWKIAVEEVEKTLEKIWELHDHISDAIHAVSRANFHNSIRIDGTEYRKAGFGGGGGGGEDEKDGCVFVKGHKQEEDIAAVPDARSLNDIRSALEDLEDQLEFLHTVKSQQNTEREAAIGRLEQSRIILARRLSDHHGNKYRVIEEALAFISWFQSQGLKREKKATTLMSMVASNISLAKRLLGNAAMFAVSSLVLMQLNKATVNEEASQCCGGVIEKLDVWAARG